jgi:hypothetical protein
MSSGLSDPFKPSDKMLRQFSGLCIVFFGAIAARQEFHHHHRTAAIILALLAITIGPLGLIAPRAVKPIFIGWMYLAYPIGWVISHVVLGIIYYVLFTPVALFFRMTGRDALRLKPAPQAATYWQVKPRALDKSHYFRQS